MNYSKEAESAKDVISSLYERIEELENDDGEKDKTISHLEDEVSRLEDANSNLLLIIDSLEQKLKEAYKIYN